MALRSAHFERDFKGGPKVLLWGDVEGMRDLRDFLRQLQTAEAPRTLTSLCEAADGKEITVVPSFDVRENGMCVRKDRLEWKLDPTAAHEFAGLVDALTDVSDGHQYLECPGDEVGVMVSTGEYPANLRP
jgi:hypothetical protein